MRTLSILRTQAFRIVIVYVAVFALSVSALLAFTYWNTERALDAQTDQIISAEIAGLSEQYQQLGIRGLADVVMSRSAHGGPGLYLLLDRRKQYIAGNLDGMPQNMSRQGVEVEFDYQRRIEGSLQNRRARGRRFQLMGGFELLVAQDVHERYLTEKLFSTDLPWTVGLMLLLGLVGGGLMSRNMLRRLDQINRTAGEIVAGDFSRRVPVTNAHDEFDTLAESLNRMLDRIGRLMAGVREVTDSVAHDLRTPLTRLRNRLDDILRHSDPADDRTAEIESAMRETDQIIGTFNALLLIAEADSGVMRGAMTSIDLVPIVGDMAELYAPLAEENQVTLEIKPAGETVIEGNRSLISQALANLIDNAIKYTPVGGHISVWTTMTPNGAELTVADTGPGIPADQRAHVLERFVRLETSRNSPGTGLGLSLVAAVARLHGAKLLLDDNHPGLKATIRFPRRVPRQAARR
ncbi:MAG: HAMP domain-containing histidine kinase [Alphaproteobacteria bacterium]|nr:HAMP domain-containing histidine kinase [Alphaproteobacteria bacterium]